MSKEMELKPCPFCGGSAGFSRPRPDALMIRCGRCKIARSASLKNKAPAWVQETLTEQWNSRQQAPAEHAVEPVAMLLIGETELTTQGWEHGDFDIEWTKAAEAFAQNAEPGEHPLYAAPVDQSARIAELEGLLRETGEDLSDWRRSFFDVDTSVTDSLIARVDAALAKHGEADHD